MKLFMEVGRPREMSGEWQVGGGEKKARLRKARRLLIVPFKTKILMPNMLDNYVLLPGLSQRISVATYDNQMTTG